MTSRIRILEVQSIPKNQKIRDSFYTNDSWHFDTPAYADLKQHNESSRENYIECLRGNNKDRCLRSYLDRQTAILTSAADMAAESMSRELEQCYLALYLQTGGCRAARLLVWLRAGVGKL